VSFPPHLLDELARLFARAALDRFVQESEARKSQSEENTSVQSEPKSQPESAPESESDSDQPKYRDIDGDSNGR
jgi:hypothetical protein